MLWMIFQNLALPTPLLGYIDLQGIEVRDLTFLYENPVVINDFPEKMREQNPEM